MSGRGVAIALSDKENSPTPIASDRCRLPGASASFVGRAEALDDRGFLRIPPFPGARVASFVRHRFVDQGGKSLVELLKSAKVGGTYWAAMPELPLKYALVREPAALPVLKASGDDAVVLWTNSSSVSAASPDMSFAGECDPWHMLARATMLVTTSDDDLCLVASVLGVPAYRFEASKAALVRMELDPFVLLESTFSSTYENPFTGELMDARKAIELCSFWRRHIDRNRAIVAGLGFAFWKRKHVSPLLWGGGAPVRFVRKLGEGEASDGAVAVWRAKASAEEISLLERRNTSIIEVEDGFLRSQGLGADCVPPLSITVDRLGPHFDPTGPSELEHLLQEGAFDQGLLDRAARIREALVEAGIGKYERSEGIATDRLPGKRRKILVPGQVEDDRAVQRGGCGLVSNLDLLARVRAQAPDAYILYKPHPDVLAGHRRGAISERACLEHADEITAGGAISSIIEMIDEVHVNTSLAGFEALLRDKPVTTFGVPFYAGWGLTRDLGPVPARRTATRTLDELVAAALLLYPRYLDPITGLPCPAEVVVERLTRASNPRLGPLVRMRRFQGKLLRRVRGFIR